MSLICFTSLLLLFIWLTDRLLWPIQLFSAIHLFNWLSLSIFILVFAWLAAE